ncbi:MAG: TIGR04282 family arsenosugar biosynthesis glycosyltransferase [Planctomycetes bacterium]|nr:TIGR04282 family arsenosugar biosynthesis glycosyltransferase [Planctomycetota bacterium]
MKDVRLLIFAKYPTPGRVMTRLCPPLQPHEAAEVHRACLVHTCERAACASAAHNVVVFSPDDSPTAMRRVVGAGLDLWPQGGGDLGQRLAWGIDRALDQGARGVLCVGTDSPTFWPTALERAASALDRADLVLGPCEDGGFYLLGVTTPVGKLFEGVAWGGPQVTRRVLHNAAGLQMRVAQLETGYDLDRPADLRRVLDDLVRSENREPPGELRRVLARMVEVTRTRDGAEP